MLVAVRTKDLPTVVVALMMVILFLMVETVTAQQPAQEAQPGPPPGANPSAPQPPTPPPATQQQSLSSSLGLYVFPAKYQTLDQQHSDESGCFSWAKEQTGIDPTAIPPQPNGASLQQQRGQHAQPSAPDPSKGFGIEGDEGGAAAIGATASAVRDQRQGRKARKQSEEQQRHAQALQQQAQMQGQDQSAGGKGAYQKAFSVCMEGKGYTVK